MRVCAVVLCLFVCAQCCDMQSSRIAFENADPITLKVGIFNIANCKADEESETTNFWVRQEALVRQINEIDADVLVLNELRPFRNRVTGDMMQPPAFLGRLERFANVYTYFNASPTAFGVGILYRRDVVYVLQTRTMWLSTTPGTPSDTWGNGNGRVVFAVQFAPVSDGRINMGRSFWVMATHLGLGEAEKDASVALLAKMCQVESVRGEACFVVGDMNFFADKNGPAQRAVLTSAGMIDAGAAAVFSFDAEQRCHGTFIGFETDPYKSTVETLLGKGDGVPSRLDHVFVSPGARVIDARVYAESYEQLRTRKTPSDHLPLVCTCVV